MSEIPLEYSETAVFTAIQLTIALGKDGVDGVYRRADASNASRAEVIDQYIRDLAEIVCDIWRKYCEPNHASWLQLVWKYSEMVRQKLATENDSDLPLPTYAEFLAWLVDNSLAK